MAPRQYEAIKESLLKRGASLKKAKSEAAATFIKRGGNKKARSARARALHSD